MANIQPVIPDLSILLSQEEYLLVNDDIREKVNIFLKDQFLKNFDLGTQLKALSHSNERVREQNENELTRLAEVKTNQEVELSKCHKELHETRNELSNVKHAFHNLEETNKRLQVERDEIQSRYASCLENAKEISDVLQTRDASILEYKNKLANLGEELERTLNDKYNAILQTQDAKSNESLAKQREICTEEEKKLLVQQMEGLNATLKSYEHQLANLRRECTDRNVDLKTKFNQKLEECRVAMQTINDLKSTNISLNERLEASFHSVTSLKERESTLHERYRQELDNQIKVSELYKEAANDTNANMKDIKVAMGRLQSAFKEENQKCKKLETLMEEKEALHKTDLVKKEELIKELKLELQKSSALFDCAKEDELEGTMAEVTPTAVAVNRLIKSGLTISQVYSELKSTTESLIHEKGENARLTVYIQGIVKEIEERAPAIMEQKNQFLEALQKVAYLTDVVDISAEENGGLRAKVRAAESKADHHKRKSSLFEQQLNDLSRQVCYLLMQLEDRQQVMPPTHMDTTSSSRLISEHLVTFSSVKELQENNQKLLAVVRELSQWQEETEKMVDLNPATIQAKLDGYVERIQELEEVQKHQNDMILNVMAQRDTFHHLCDIGKDEQQVEATTLKASTIQLDTKTRMEKLELELEEARKELTSVYQETNRVREDRVLNDEMTNKQINSMRDEIMDLKLSNFKLVTKGETLVEHQKVLQVTSDSYKNQVAAEEAKNKILDRTISQHEKTILELKDVLVRTQSNLSCLEVKYRNDHVRLEMLSERESHLLRIHEDEENNRQHYTTLLGSLQEIHSTLDDRKQKQEVRQEKEMEDLKKEYRALQLRFQEEEEKYRDLLVSHGHKLKMNENTLKAEKHRCDQHKAELASLQAQLVQKQEEHKALSDKIHAMSSAEKDSSEQSKKVIGLELTLSHTEKMLLLAKEDLAKTHERSVQSSNIANMAEKQVEAHKAVHLKELATIQSRLMEAETSNKALRAELDEASSRLSELTAAQKDMLLSIGKDRVSGLEVERDILKQEKMAHQADLDAMGQRFSLLESEVTSLRLALRELNERYNRSLSENNEKTEEMERLKIELSNKSLGIAETEAKVGQGVEALRVAEEAWERLEEVHLKHRRELKERVDAVEEQNRLLLNQLNTMASSMTSDIMREGNRPGENYETAGPRELLDILKFVKQEKELALTRCEAVKASYKRLEMQVDILKAEASEAQQALARERDSANLKRETGLKHEDLIRKLETVNALADTSAMLREQRDSLQTARDQLVGRVAELENQMKPLLEQEEEWSSKVEVLSAENKALRNEAARLRQRITMLAERTNKTNAEEMLKLTQERDNLSSVLAMEKGNCVELQGKLNKLKAQLESEMAQALRQQSSLRENVASEQQRLAKAQAELTEMRALLNKNAAELTALNEELAGKETILNDARNKEIQIRKIAKKYKSQFEDLTKEVTAERAAAEQGSTNNDRVRVEAQEQVAGLEAKLKQAEEEHATVVQLLTDQVASARAEADNVCQELSTFKANVETKELRTKNMLKCTRTKIIQLSENKTKVDEENLALKAHTEAIIAGKDELEARMKSRVASLEKENMDRAQECERLLREMEDMIQRLAQLQRLLDKQQGGRQFGKTEEKSDAEPPTANIRPMAGPSSSAPRPPQSQQSVTVTPWPGRGETPLASIRPMSQNRTAAVHPTSQLQTNASSQIPSSQGSLMLCHTTASAGSEVLSSSPTSSHTDYMPATSSAGAAVGQLRQVVVQPTVTTATVSPSASSREELGLPTAESTQQDPEVEDSSDVSPAVCGTPQQQAVALVLPRVEQQSTTTQTQQQVAEQSVAVASSQAASSSSTVTTTQAGTKRPRQDEVEGDSSTGNDEQEVLEVKRARPGVQDVYESGLDVEYQVPTSSQRDQEDDCLPGVDSEAEEEEEEEEGGADDGVMDEPDEGRVFEDGVHYMDYERAEQELASYDGPDIDEMNVQDNEVEIHLPQYDIEVPNQSTGGVVDGDIVESASGAADIPEHPAQQQSEATSSGFGGPPEVANAVTQSASFNRTRTIPPLSRQQQHILLPQSYEDAGDDSIVPSTPTLFVPRRTDGFGEAVSSPHVPSGRFTFAETSVPTARAGVAQVALEGMDDTRMDLTQLDESGTGRSVPTTPLQVSPQGEAEVQPESFSASEGVVVVLSPIMVPSITVTAAADQEQLDEQPQEMALQQAAGEPSLDDDGNGVTSEGEPRMMGRPDDSSEAEATTPDRRGRRSGKARRCYRGMGRRGGLMDRPTPIVWNEPGSTSRGGFGNSFRVIRGADMARGFGRGFRRPKRNGSKFQGPPYPRF